MHPALENTDIVNNIINQLAGGAFTLTAVANSQPKHQEAILHFGLSRKSFLEPSLDRLWVSIVSLAPLVLVLPVSAERGLSSEDFELGIVSDRHWTRLLYYAQRICHFSSDGKSLSDAAYSRLSCLYKGPILPALKSFQLSWTSDSRLAELALVLSSNTIADFGLTVSKGVAPNRTLLNHIFCSVAQTQPTNITSLSIWAYPGSLLAQFTSLQSLSIAAPVSTDCLFTISTLPNIQILDILLHNTNYQDLRQVYAQVPYSDFPNLRSLKVGGPLNAITAYFDRIGAYFLSSLSIRSTAHEYRWSSAISIIRTKWLKGLRHWYFVQDGTRSKDLDSLASNFYEFAGGVLGVISLRLEGVCHFSQHISLSKVFQNFANLKHLFLRNDTGGNLSWSVLKQIHSHLPALESLSIWLNYNEHSALNDKLDSIVAHPLRWVTITGMSSDRDLSPIIQAAIARSLERLFPVLELSSPSGEIQTVVEIQAFITMFREIRMEESTKKRST